MAKLIYALSQSLDGYVDHSKLGPPPPAAGPRPPLRLAASDLIADNLICLTYVPA